MTNIDTNIERTEAQSDLSERAFSSTLEGDFEDRISDTCRTEQDAFKSAMLALGLDPSTAPDLSALRAPRVEIERAPRLTAAERAFTPLSTSEWHLVRGELERALTRPDIDWKARRVRWNSLLFAVATGTPWARIPSRFGTPESGRKHFENGSRSGVIERVAASLSQHPELCETRRAQFAAAAIRAREKQERLLDTRNTAARMADQRKAVGLG